MMLHKSRVSRPAGLRDQQAVSDECRHSLTLEQDPQHCLAPMGVAKKEGRRGSVHSPLHLLPRTFLLPRLTFAQRILNLVTWLGFCPWVITVTSLASFWRAFWRKALISVISLGLWDT